MQSGHSRELDETRPVRRQLLTVPPCRLPLQSEAGMIVSGLGWDPEECKWNRGRNVQIREIE